LSKAANRTERLWMGKVASLGCIACRRIGNGHVEAQVHHIRQGQGMGQRAPHVFTIPLCLEHHSGSSLSVHMTHKTFERVIGTEEDLLAQTIEEVASCLL